MNNDEIFRRAEAYLENRRVQFVKPGEIGMSEGDQVEVIYLVPQALIPGGTADPPDVRVWVNTKSGKVEWIDQM